jgi:hypothetical protein
MPPKAPHAIGDAISATIILWDHALGVSYAFPNGDREAHALGPDDRLGPNLQ